MAGAFAGSVGIGLPCSTKLSHTTTSRSSRFSRVKMAVTLDEKKNFTLKKSEEAFNAAKVYISHFLSLSSFHIHGIFRLIGETPFRNRWLFPFSP